MRMPPPGQPAALYTLFTRSAERYPGLVALEVDGLEFTYRELRELVDRLAATVVAAAGGAVPARVGVLASRSLAAYAGYLATLRLDATVIPLNPSAPAARNSFICASAEVDLLLTDEAGEVVTGAGVPALTLDPAWHLDGRLPPPWSPPHRGSADDLAYIAFTSGSTGTPKGVPVRNRNVVPCIVFCLQQRALGPGCRLAQTFELTFDLCPQSMFLAWASGATLVSATQHDVLTPARFVTDLRITHWYSVPSVISLAQRLRTLEPGSMPSLRCSMFCGEALRLDQARAWATAAPNGEIWNLYGPTELAMTCAEYRLPDELADWPSTPNGTVPIGSVYPHLDALILDENGASGTEGELCVRGAQRFDGYLDAGDNAGRFVDLEDGDGPPAERHWYRTGDRVRAHVPGDLLHLGRVDRQVKIRGHRIELGEIEFALRQHARVCDAVVLALPAADGELDLHAAYTGDRVPEAELAAVVEASLPGYMVPRTYHHTDEFPTNANGKTDRNRLATELTAVGATR
jgi:amino acid adenylation domain-containing protein